MNQLTWDLSELFNNNTEFYQEIEKVNLMIEEVNKYNDINIDNSNLLLNLLNEYWKIKEIANNILVYGSLMYYKNVRDEECIKLKKDAETLNNKVINRLKSIELKILNLGPEKINNYIKNNNEIKIYELFLDNLFRMKSHTQDSETNKIIEGNNNNINDNITQYNNLLRDINYGNIEVDNNIVELNASNASKYLCSKNRDTRKQAYMVINKSFKEKEKEFEEILKKICQLRIDNSNLEKYSSVLEKALFEENIDSKIIDVLIEEVNNNLPLIQKYLSLKTNFLDINNPHVYDLDVSLLNNLDIKFTIEEAIDIIKNALEPLGEEYVNIVNILLNKNFDAKLDPNKHQTITFSWNAYSFMNFKGSYIDLKNMIHELGHIVNYYLSQKKQPFMYTDSTVFVGETASIVNEILLNKYLYKNANNEDEKLFYLTKQIDNYILLVYKQTMYTELENELYNNNLNEINISEVYKNLVKRYYGNSIVYDNESDIEWTRLGKLFRWNYYHYKYATGLLIANVVVNSLLEEKILTKKQYMYFLESGSNAYSLELLKSLNIDLTNSKIINNGFKDLEFSLNEFEKILTLRKKH